MRICFELLELLKAPRKSIRRAAVSTFGFIAKAIGPQDVLHTLLNNLRSRTGRIAFVQRWQLLLLLRRAPPAHCAPSIDERVPCSDLNVQNGVLKALSFLFECIGPMGESPAALCCFSFSFRCPRCAKRSHLPTFLPLFVHYSHMDLTTAKDYICHAITPLITKALQDRDIVHRQTASSATKHMCTRSPGLGCEDAVLHLLNHVWPNIFEQSLACDQGCVGGYRGLPCLPWRACDPVICASRPIPPGAACEGCVLADLQQPLRLRRRSAHAGVPRPS